MSKRKTTGLDNWRALGWRPAKCPPPNGYAKGRESMRLGNCCLNWQTCGIGARVCPDCCLAFCQYHGEQHAYRQGTSWMTWNAAQPQLHVKVVRARPAPVNGFKRRRMEARTPDRGSNGQDGRGVPPSP